MLGLETNIFGLKMTKSGLEFLILKFHQPSAQKRLNQLGRLAGISEEVSGISK